MNEDHILMLRRLHYRLKRQGMAELDTWLEGLEKPLQMREHELLLAVEALLTHEVPELQAMMRGERPLPEILRPWLELHP